jgi:hypothetical protein
VGVDSLDGPVDDLDGLADCRKTFDASLTTQQASELRSALKTVDFVNFVFELTLH